jgi:GAF domain-containing protein
MTARTVAQALADAASALTGDSDVTDMLARLVDDARGVLGAQAVGLLLLTESGDLELLSATSHRAAELEIFQIQHDAGPCVDAIRAGTVVSVTGTSEIRSRWPDTGPAIVDAGYSAVHAYPLRWHGRTLGAMNVFRDDASPQQAASEDDTGQAFANIATIVIVQPGGLTRQQVTDRVQQALEARTVIEQAKGVLAYTRDLDMSAAYDLLRAQAADSRASLTATAADVIARAQER